MTNKNDIFVLINLGATGQLKCPLIFKLKVKVKRAYNSLQAGLHVTQTLTRHGLRSCGLTRVALIKKYGCRRSSGAPGSTFTTPPLS